MVTQTLPSDWLEAGFTAYDPGQPRPRALVLAGGGATGIAWESGYLFGLREGGVDVRTADTVIGTSAGSVVGAHLRLGRDDGESLREITQAPALRGMGRWGLLDATRFAVAQVAPEARTGRALLGRAALHAKTMTEAEWLAIVAGPLHDQPWPEQRLLITAVDALTGVSVVFDNGAGVPLERAVAASCTVPGFFPPVQIKGRRYIDGGMRSIANIDLAAGHERVLTLAPFPVAVRPKNRPGRQLAALGPQVRRYLAHPDKPSRRAMGLNPFDMRRTLATFETALVQGRAAAPRLAELWND